MNRCMKKCTKDYNYIRQTRDSNNHREETRRKKRCQIGTSFFVVIISMSQLTPISQKPISRSFICGTYVFSIEKTTNGHLHNNSSLLPGRGKFRTIRAYRNYLMLRDFFGNTPKTITTSHPTQIISLQDKFSIRFPLLRMWLSPCFVSWTCKRDCLRRLSRRKPAARYDLCLGINPTMPDGIGLFSNFHEQEKHHQARNAH